MVISAWITAVFVMGLLKRYLPPRKFFRRGEQIGKTLERNRRQKCIN